nr:MAG TPA: hypothetical protein [Caudoviricetes sp.]
MVLTLTAMVLVPVWFLKWCICKYFGMWFLNSVW